MMKVLGVPLDRCHLLGWRNTADLARCLLKDQGSYIWRAQHEEECRYGERLQTNAMLADVYDLLANFATAFAAAHSKSRPKKPKRYPRPWEKCEQRIGRDPIPIKDFDSWYYGGEDG